MRNKIIVVLEYLTYGVDQCLHLLITGEWWKGNINDWRKLK